MRHIFKEVIYLIYNKPSVPTVAPRAPSGAEQEQNQQKQNQQQQQSAKPAEDPNNVGGQIIVYDEAKQVVDYHLIVEKLFQMYQCFSSPGHILIQFYALQLHSFFSLHDGQFHWLAKVRFFLYFFISILQFASKYAISWLNSYLLGSTDYL